MREEFEKLPEIAAKLEYCRYSSSKNKYVSHWYNTAFINGAWYAYQEQQKKIDGALDLACKHQYSNGERIYNEIKEFLK
jgi:hypothetical protein